jgi:hypothetical protein
MSEGSDKLFCRLYIYTDRLKVNPQFNLVEKVIPSVSCGVKDTSPGTSPNSTLSKLTQA